MYALAPAVICAQRVAQYATRGRRRATGCFANGRNEADRHVVNAGTTAARFCEPELTMTMQELTPAKTEHQATESYVTLAVLAMWVVAFAYLIWGG
jgi:hypothetical protein